MSLKRFLFELPAVIANAREGDRICCFNLIVYCKQMAKTDQIPDKRVVEFINESYELLTHAEKARIAKFLKEICLVDQAFVKDPDQTVRDLLKAKDTHVTGFIRFEVGEGIEKSSQDFAEEVRAQVQGST